MPNPIAATDPFTCVPIECCDPYTENLIARFDSLEAAGKAGFDPDSIRAVLAGKCHEYSRAIWRIAVPTKPAPPAPQCRRRKVQSCPNAVAVEAYDLATGETVKAYPSLGAVAEDGFEYQKVQSASLRGTSYGGLGWRRVASTETNKRYASNAPRVIQAIDPSTGRVVKTYPSLSALAGEGFQPACVRRVIDGAYRQYKGCLWLEIAAPDDYRTPRQLAYARAVQSFDPETGRTIQEYGSLAEAEAAGFVGVGIRNAIQNGWRHHGVRWRYAQADTVENRGGHKPAPVESYDLTTGRTIKCYPNRNATALDGYRPEIIRVVLKGRHDQHKGVGWRYATSPATPAADPPAVTPPLPTNSVSQSRAQTKRSIEAFDPASSETVEVFNDIGAAVSRGYCRRLIENVLSGLCPLYRGFGWRYADRHPQPHALESCDAAKIEPRDCPRHP